VGAGTSPKGMVTVGLPGPMPEGCHQVMKGWGGSTHMPEMMVVNKKVFANLIRRVVGLIVALFSFAMLQMAAYSLFSVQKDPAYMGWAQWAWLPHPLPSQRASMWGATVIVLFPHFMMVVACCFMAVGHQREGWGLLGCMEWTSSMLVMWLGQGGHAVGCMAGERWGQPAGACSWAVGDSSALGWPFPACVCCCLTGCCQGLLQGLVSRRLE